MKHRNTLSCVLLSAAVILTAKGVAAAQDHVTTNFALATELYESAQYERALAAMDRIDSSALTSEQARDQAIYAALCLLALDRKVEADTRIQSLIRAEPLFNPPSDTPPRLKTIIESARRHLRPLLAQEHYEAGKEEFDRKNFAAALKEFTLVVDLTEDTSDTAVSAMRDVHVLAAGFLDLSRRALAPPGPSSPPPTTVAKTTLAVIDPPVAIHQVLPQMSKELVIQIESRLSSFSGVLDLVIDAHGDVKSATLEQPIHPYYDQLLLSAAKNWKYRAAMRNGEPVEYEKRLTIKLDVRRATSINEPLR
jgi:tetratricopeptide (TPR) repeat protein